MPTPAQPQPSSGLRAIPGWIRANRLITAGLLLLILTGLGLEAYLPYLNGPPQWRWLYAHFFDFWPTWCRALAWLLAGLVVIGAPLLLAGRRLRRPAARRALGLAGLLLFGLFYHGLGFTLASLGGFTHFGRIMMDSLPTGFFTIAQRIDQGELPPLPETLRRYPELLPRLLLHPSTHPPGQVILSYAAIRLFETHPGLVRAAVPFFEGLGIDTAQLYPAPLPQKAAACALATLVAGLGLLGALPLFGLIRASLGPAPHAEPTAWCAAALWVLHPALALFEPLFDQVYPTLVLLCLYCATRGFRARGLRARPRTWGAALIWGAATGLLFMLAISLSFTLLLLAPMLLLLAALELARQAGSWRPAALLAQARPSSPQGRRLLLLTGAAVAVCLAVDLLLRAAWGIRLAAIFFAALRHQNDALLPGIQRSYPLWLVFNVYDFLFFAGPVAALLALAGWGRAAREAWRSPAALVPACAVFPLTLLALDLSGLTPAETSRIWLFLAPGLVWAAAGELARRPRLRLNLALVLLAQSAFYYLLRCKLQIIRW